MLAEAEVELEARRFRFFIQFYDLPVFLALVETSPRPAIGQAAQATGGRKTNWDLSWRL